MHKISHDDTWQPDKVPFSFFFESLLTGHKKTSSLIFLFLSRIAVRWSGMRLKTVTDDKGFTFTFGERGQPIQGRPSVLFLHGFSADHFMWAPIVQVCSYLCAEIAHLSETSSRMIAIFSTCLHLLVSVTVAECQMHNFVSDVPWMDGYKWILSCMLQIAWVMVLFSRKGGEGYLVVCTFGHTVTFAAHTWSANFGLLL